MAMVDEVIKVNELMRMIKILKDKFTKRDISNSFDWSDEEDSVVEAGWLVDSWAVLEAKVGKTEYVVELVVELVLADGVFSWSHDGVDEVAFGLNAIGVGGIYEPGLSIRPSTSLSS